MKLVGNKNVMTSSVGTTETDLFRAGDLGVALPTIGGFIKFRQSGETLRMVNGGLAENANNKRIRIYRMEGIGSWALAFDTGIALNALSGMWQLSIFPDLHAEFKAGNNTNEFSRLWLSSVTGFNNGFRITGQGQVDSDIICTTSIITIDKTQVIVTGDSV